MLLQERFGYYDPTFELARIAVEQHHGVLWWKNDADELRAQLVTPEFHGSWLAGAILVAADAAEVGTKPGRRYLAGDREPRCPEDRAWLGLVDDVVAMQRFRLERESGLAVTWIQDFVPTGQLVGAGLSGDEANLFAAGVALIRQAQIRCNADSVGNDGILWGRYSDLRRDAGFPDWKWARYVDDVEILWGVPAPDYHWEKAAGFEDWLRDHPGKDAWVPRVRAAFDRKARFNNRTFGEWESISREPGFALIAALSSFDTSQGNGEWRRANGDQIDRLCDSVITLNEQMSAEWWSQWTSADTTPDTPEQTWTAAVISLATLFARAETVSDPSSVIQLGDS
ncbi:MULTISPECIES: hypothetical protein [Rhodococcus]|uniref:hypothetical protein n=1 Tax=Rhodococcus TaxID=1827 RepID=UPI0004C38E10|nr:MULTISPECIES: hypothetical protein [Rhodococcus]MCJ0901383.1 hypothetical protein [Rhodococcus sp. ARC_M13]UKO83675.1 hypothetical protein ITJ47_00985 [Rhodococcus erythropolis]BBE49170.1 hypothetical protein RE2895_61010 [Rhodococcus erythropolis]